MAENRMTWKAGDIVWLKKPKGSTTKKTTSKPAKPAKPAKKGAK